MKLKKNLKGSEKPIEIFVALFVILAVAMVLLKLFSGQVADKSNELNEFSERSAALDKCAQYCSSAKTNTCRDEDLIRFCTSYFKLDLDSNAVVGENNEYPYTICEDKIYCPLVADCQCGIKLDMRQCLDLTKRYYNEKGIDLSIILNKYDYTEGACEEGKPETWYALFDVESYAAVP